VYVEYFETGGAIGNELAKELKTYVKTN